MNFDKTFIAIRQRNIVEIADLSLHVIRDHLVPLAGLLAVGALPFFLFNWLAVGWLVQDTFQFEASDVLFVWVMSLVVSSQAQLGTVFVTAYLGQALFQGRPSVKDILISSLRAIPKLIVIHGFVRLVIPSMVLLALMRPGFEDPDGFAWLVILFSAVTGIGLMIRGSRPFATEMLVLEKTPLSKSKDDQNAIDYGTRSSSLHNAASGEVFGRSILMAFLAVPLSFIFFVGILLIDQSLNLHIDNQTSLLMHYWPAALWIVAGMMAVIRFLSYIDIRIRQEGWAVELRVRAEAMRLAQMIE